MRTLVGARGSFLRAEPTRSSTEGFAVLGADEINLGAAASFSLGKARAFLGVAYEHREPGHTALVLAGVPHSSYF